jgi:uncharacterized protein (DUF362 family)
MYDCELIRNLKNQQQVFVSRLKENPRGNFSWLLEHLKIPDSLSTICIKANLNDYRKWETASTCDPNILDGLLSVLRDRYPHSSIILLENSSTSVNADNIFAFLGMDLVANRYNCRCINAAREQWSSVEIDGLHFKRMDVPAILKDAFFITFPKLKSHAITKLTCGLKNQMGLFRPKRKIVYHHIVHELIVDCNLAMRPMLSLVDANLVMEGNYGPTHGSPRKLGLLIASKDVVAADSLCAKFFNFNPKSIRYINEASKRGVGNTKSEVIADFNFNISDYKLKFSPLLFYAIRIGAGGIRR